jgi:hypothetical protein
MNVWDASDTGKQDMHETLWQKKNSWEMLTEWLIRTLQDIIKMDLGEIHCEAVAGLNLYLAFGNNR